ncbi:NADH:ubiquinone reductase (Na(+)-transporting) subunit B [Cryomorphaceae bacterium 1068]|nr:NADH:ubiquinone reductase (Na(+)-transporting) subunit B [Cryomorphaceae bacterium 1068]
MKVVENLLGKVKPIFDKGGKLEKLYPMYDALETFAFVPDHTTHKGAHIRDSIDMKRTMFLVIVALIPCLLFGIYNTGYQHFLALQQEASFMEMVVFGLWKAIPLIIVSYGVGLGVEFIFCIIKGHSIQEGFLVSGMLIPLIMPMDVPLWMVAIATAFAVLIAKEVFGGTGMNILNVALTARVFLFFAYPTMMSGNKVWVNTEGGTVVDGFTGETLLGQAISRGADFYDTAGVAYASVSDSFMASFLGFIPGSIGETSTLAILIGAAILLWTGVASWRIMLSAVIGGAVMGLIFNILGPQVSPDNLYLQVPWWHQLVMGGFMFGVVFMATDPVSAAQTYKGKVIYGFLIGILGILIRVANPAYPEGIMLAILFMNVMAPTIDHYVVQGNINKRLKRLKTA